MSLNNQPTARDMGYQGIVHTIVTPISYLSENVVVDATSKLPAGASVIGGGVHITEAFNDTGTDTIDVGFRDGTTADDPNAYGTLLNAGAVGFVPLDELGATTNIRQDRDTVLTWTYNGLNNDATAGAGVLIINYVLASA